LIFPKAGISVSTEKIKKTQFLFKNGYLKNDDNRTSLLLCSQHMIFPKQFIIKRFALIYNKNKETSIPNSWVSGLGDRWGR